jgi:hypothetical protein
MNQPVAVPFGIYYLEQLPNMGYDILDKSKSSMGHSKEQGGQATSASAKPDSDHSQRD